MVNPTSINIVRPEALTDKHFHKQAAQEFLDILGAPPYVFQTFGDKQDDRDPSLTKTFYGTLEQHYNKLVELNKRGAGIFVTVNETSGNTRKAEDVVSVRACFIDCDKQLPKDSYHLEPTMIVRTSGKRGHAYWVFDTPDKNVSQFKDVQKKLIEHYGSDKAVHDLPRVMRIPGFYHMKYTPTLVELVRIDPKCKYKNITEVVAGVNTQAVLRNKVESNANQKVIVLPNSHKQDIHPSKCEGLEVSTPITNNEFKALLFDVQNASEGTRNDTLNKAAFKTAELITNGAIAYDVAHQALVNTGVQAGLSEAEARRTVDSGISGGVSKLAVREPQSSDGKLLALLKREYAARLEWNVLKDSPMLDGETVDYEDLETDVIERYDISVNFDKLKRFAKQIAKQQPVNLVARYLNSLEIPANTDILDTLYNDVLGLKTELEKTYVRKTLIAAVARALNPGCKVDAALVLYSQKQGLGKTSFFQALASMDFFATIVASTGNERDDLPVFHSNWINELGELETAYKKRDVSELKAFMTRQTDKYTQKFANTAIERPRSFIVVGSTNEDDFLRDTTGNRRFLVCTIEKQINVQWVETHRDEIWSAALKLYKAKEQWWLTDEEQAQSDMLNQNFMQHDPTEDKIIQWLSGYYIAEGGVHFKPSMMDNCELTVGVVMESALGIKPADFRKHNTSVGKIMKQLGFTTKKTVRQGRDTRYLVHPNLAVLIAKPSEAVEDSPF